ncbi:MAG: HAMP domain-containing histidine kinase, partial [Candidatus Zixiibacteriota bacterium]
FTADLMGFSKMEPNYELCQVNRLVADVIDFLKTQKNFQSVDLTFEGTATEITSLADVNQCQQLLYNLINNAADATLDRAETESRRIGVRTEHSLDNESFALSVKDNGSGFDPEHLDRAFKERFTTKKGGHGFGLLVCKRIIENHEGELHIDSSPGSGTTIRITFPVRAPAPQPTCIS